MDIEDKDFYFGEGNVDFDPDGVDASVLEMTDIDDLDTDDVFAGLEYFDAGEVNTTVPFRSKDDDEIAREVEDTFISLLSSGDDSAILHLTGESPIASGMFPDDFISDFKSQYFRAVTHNPAVKWYAKLVKLMPEGKFGVKDGNLRLAMTPKMFRKALLPFLGDFDVQSRDMSPLTDLVFSLASNIQDEDVQDKLAKIMDSSQVNAVSEDDLNCAEIEMDDEYDFDTSSVEYAGEEAELNVDEFDVMSGPSVDFDNNEVAVDENKLPFKLRDLGIKVIADWFISQDTDEDTIQASLEGEGFKKAQINSIIGVVRYKKLDSVLKPTGNFGGDVDFPFKI